MPDNIQMLIKHILVAVIICFGVIAGIASGGGGGDGNGVINEDNNDRGNQTKNAPIISSLSTTPGLTTFSYITGEGSQTIYGKIDFIDNDANLWTIVIDIFDSNKNPVSHTDYFGNEQLSPGLTSGTLEFTLTADTIVSNATYTFEIYAVDYTNLKSNTLTGTYENTFAISISNLFYTPKYISAGSGEGTIHVRGEFEIDRHIGNMNDVTWSIDFFNPDGNWIDGMLYDPEDSTDPSMIHTSWDYELDTSSEGNYAFQIHLINTVASWTYGEPPSELTSNILEGEFVVYSGIKESAPIISNLTYSPTSAIVDPNGGEILINASVDYNDNDGNVTQIHCSVYNSAKQLLQWGWGTINPEASGEGQAYFFLNLDNSTAENYTFEVYVIDESNYASNVLIGEFSVIN